MKASELVPSRLYSFKYTGVLPMLVKDNPLLGRVTVNKTIAGQAASECMYKRAQLLLNPQHVFNGKSQGEPTQHPVLVMSDDGRLKARLMNTRTTSIQYLVDGIPANTEQLATIQAYKKVRTRNPLSVKIQFPYLDSLENVTNDVAQLEEQED